jgi:hypothetical protein
MRLCISWKETANRLSDRSALLPTNTIITSLPRSDLTSSIHFDVDMNDALSIKSGIEKHHTVNAREHGIRSKCVLLTCNIKYHDGN